MAEITRVIRPAAVLRPEQVDLVLRALQDLDVSKGGIWVTNPGLWQRYDHAWDGLGGMAGTSKLVGTIGAAYGQPTRYEITIYRVTVTDHGVSRGWTVESLCNDAIGYAGLTLDNCTRAEMDTPPSNDPFKS